MLYKPKTLEEARKTKYAEWAGNPGGYKYREGRCAYEVYPRNGWIPYQCSFRNGHGPDGLYCKIHAKKLSE
jgi:hypothetical protein